MSIWTKRKVGDVITLEYGKGLVAKDRTTGPYPVFGSSGNVGSHSDYLIEGPGIIVGRKGSVGEVYYTKSDYYPIDTVYFVRSRNEEYDSYFLYMALKALNLKRLQGDTGVPGLNRETAYGETIFLPDLPTQSRIASVLSAYDDLIESNEKRIKILEEMAERLYREWFVKFKFPGYEKVCLIDSGTEYGKIPEGWEVVEFNKAVNVNPSAKLENKQNIIHVPMESLSNTSSVVDTSKIFIKNGGTGVKFKNNDILFARITPCLQNGKNGFVNFLKQGEIATGSTEFIVMRANKLTPIYIYFLTRDADFRKAAEMTMVGASGRQRVQNAFFHSYMVMVPSYYLLRIFEDQVQAIFAEIIKLHKANKNLSKTRDLLIPQLVTGKREVK